MKQITVITLGLLLASTPAFAYFENTQNLGGAVVDQAQINNTVGNVDSGSLTDAGNGGASNVNTNNSSGVISQNVNTGASSNVGSATAVSVSGGFSTRGGNIDAGNPGNTTDQLAVAALEQVSVGNVTGDASQCSATSAYNAGVSNANVNASSGIIAQQINTGVSSNVGSAISVTVH